MPPDFPVRSPLPAATTARRSPPGGTSAPACAALRRLDKFLTTTLSGWPGSTGSPQGEYPLATFKIPYLKGKARGRAGVVQWYWEPGPALRSKGWTTIALGAEAGIAAGRALQQNRFVDANPNGPPKAKPRGRTDTPNEPPPIPKSIRDMVEQFLASDWMPPSEETRRDYRKDLRRLCRMQLEGIALGDCPARILRPKDADNLYAELKARGKTSAGRIARTARRCWKWGIRQEFALLNPWEQMNLAAAGTRDQEWERDWVAGFLWACRREGRASMALACRIAYYGGQRPTDCRTVPIGADSKVDGVGRALKVVQSKTRNSTGAVALIPLDEYPELRRWVDHALRAIRAKAGAAKPHPATPLVRREETGKVWSQSEFQREARRLMQLAGIPDDVQFKDLRATATTEMVDAGADATAASTHTGHATVVMHRRYTRRKLKQSINVAKLRRGAQRDQRRR